MVSQSLWGATNLYGKYCKGLARALLGKLMFRFLFLAVALKMPMVSALVLLLYLVFGRISRISLCALVAFLMALWGV